MPTDDQDWVDEGELTDPVQQQEQPLVKLRNQARQLDKDLKSAKKELEELRTFKALAEKQGREAEVKKFLEAVGGNPSWADLYPADKDTTPETVAAWGRQYGLIAQAPAEETTVEFGPFQPVTVGEPPKTKISYDDYQKLLKEDFGAAARAVAEGRVEGLATSL